MEDIVERLRSVGYDYDFHENALIHVAANEIESLRAQLVVAKAEIAREERRFSDLWEQLCSTQAQLAEVSAQRNASNRKIEELTDQLLATQAHAARLTRAINVAAEKFHDYAELHSLKEQTPENQEKVERNLLLSRMCDEALSTPINLDALHEDRAQTLDGAAEIVSFISQDSSCQRAAERLGRVAAEYRAKKEK